MRKKSSVLFGIICLSTGIALMLSLLLPELIWKIIIAFILILCGGYLIYK